MRRALACALVLCAASAANAKPRPDPLAIVAAKACKLPVDRIEPSEAPTMRAPPADAHNYMAGSWGYMVGDDRVMLDDENNDGKPDRRSREIATPDVDGQIDCKIWERWSHGRWHLDSVSRFENDIEITTTFRNDRPAKVDRRSAITP